jgi:hypothetical protein
MLERRREPRFRAALRVEISGTDAQREEFSERVIAINLSHNGALLWGVKAELRSGDRVVVRCLGRRVQLQVVWILEEGLDGSQVAVRRVHEEPCPWEEALPSATAVGH